MSKPNLPTGANKLTQFLHKKQDKFYLIIGDEGVILAHIKVNKIALRIFANSKESPEFKKIGDALRVNPKTPVYVLIDVLDQNYQPFSFPPVSKMSLPNLLQRRLEREMQGDALQGGYFVNRSAGLKKDWNYLLVTCPLSDALKGWLAALQDLPNPMPAIQLLPIEVQTIITHPEISDLYKPAKDVHKWEIILMHNKVSGFRQVAYKNKKMVLTRLISAGNEDFSDVIAGNIEQEIQNTIEFLRRLADKAEEIKSFHIIIVAANEIIKHIDPARMAPNVVHVFSPFALSRTIGLDFAATEKDHYTETLLASVCANARPILTFHTPFTRLVNLIRRVNKYLKMLVPALLIWVLWGLGMQGWELMNAYDALDKVTSAKKGIERQYADLEKKYSVATQQVDEMRGMIALYRLLTYNRQSPITMIQKFASIAAGGMTLKTYDWKLQNLAQLDQFNEKTTDQPDFQCLITFEIFNKGSGFDALFQTMQDFVAQAQGAFKDYSLKYDRGSSQLDFNKSSTSTPMQVTITNPVAGAAGKKKGR